MAEETIRLKLKNFNFVSWKNEFSYDNKNIYNQYLITKYKVIYEYFDILRTIHLVFSRSRNKKPVFMADFTHVL